MRDESLKINLEEVLAWKFPGRKFPRFIVRWLNSFLKVDFMNDLIVEGYEGVEFCKKAMEYLDITLQAEGLENIPADGTLYTFASNHPLGGIDGIALASLIGERFGTVSLMVNDFLMALPGLRPLCVPINKTGSQSRELPRLVEESFSSDRQVLVFPAGACSRKIDGKVQDLPWSKTFVIKSRKYERPVVPVHFIGENSKRFYRIATLNRILGEKINFTMPFLPDEMYRARHKTFKVVFGEPVPYSSIDGSKTPLQWAEWFRERVYSIS